MKTEDLIAAIAADNDTKPTPMPRAFALDLGAGFVVSALFFFAFLGLRPTFFSSLDEPRFLFKFAFSLTMAITGLVLAWRLSRPGADPGLARRAVLLAPALVVAASLIEMAVVPPDQWAARMIGHNAVHCLTLIPFMALAPLAGLFLALRHGAPSDPRRAGAAAAFAAAGFSALLYAANCPDDSPFFVAVWYMIATSIVVALGWFAGGRLLRW
ncbi:NrsF family protein [Rhodoblastus acidophilus]|uniref:NrsF family protein n=1 Tax=Candidatus Rhodoblastus alkanivorans TaxID=2954117 RepID=A0ABS9ZBA5_9HYPH|nr:NrsF family protein [Candidatus Rhodoblastus alkanivorans]MCI4679810.1 NrsF family protein [Candidatus Rhodoblastus alkanivorans]MCI4684316.1 NrsF family protein [Candidatus Rhodoblastus alkanivorans]MDI4641637.1 NrsF family protein [Rhodoblastus acidophilus]